MSASPPQSCLRHNPRRRREGAADVAVVVVAVIVLVVLSVLVVKVLVLLAVLVPAGVVASRSP